MAYIRLRHLCTSLGIEASSVPFSLYHTSTTIFLRVVFVLCSDVSPSLRGQGLTELASHRLIRTIDMFRRRIVRSIAALRRAGSLCAHIPNRCLPLRPPPETLKSLHRHLSFKLVSGLTRCSSALHLPSSHAANLVKAQITWRLEESSSEISESCVLSQALVASRGISSYAGILG